MDKDWKEIETLDRFIVWSEARWGITQYVLAGILALFCNYFRPAGTISLASMLILVFVASKFCFDISNIPNIMSVTQILQYILAPGIVGAIVLQWNFWGHVSYLWTIPPMFMGLAAWVLIEAYEKSKFIKIKS